MSSPQAHPSSSQLHTRHGSSRADGQRLHGRGAARPSELGRQKQMLARVPCSLQPPGRPIVRSSSHASRMCPNRDTLSFPCRALFWGGILEERIHHLPCEGTGTSCMYSTVLPQLQCGSASALPFLNCHRSRRDTPLGLPYRPLQSGLPLQINISSASSRPTQSFRTRRPLRWS